MNPQAIPTIGLLGGVASGKSAVAECFARLGCVVLDGDQFGHRVLEQVAVQEAAVARWGTQVMNAGVIDRKQIALRVFGQDDANAAELQFWESITPPADWCAAGGGNRPLAELRRSAPGSCSTRP